MILSQVHMPDLFSMSVTVPRGMHDEAKCGDVQGMKDLLSKGRQVDEVEPTYHDTPLILSAGHGYIRIVRLLLKHGADVNKVDKEGFNALLAASGRKSASGTWVNKFAANGITTSEISQTVETVRLLARHIPINNQNKAGDTALMLACAFGNQEIVDVLLQKKADVLRKNKIGDTALHNACKKGNLQIVEELVQRGADIDSSNVYDCTPLMSAAASGHLLIVKFLLLKGVDVNKRNSNGHTAFSLAAVSEKPDMEILKLLAKNGSNTYVDKNYSLDAPLLSQVIDKEQSFLVVKYLIRLGHDINEVDNDGCTPLMHAVKGKYLDVVQYLIKKGCALDQTDRKGETAADKLSFRLSHPKIHAAYDIHRKMLSELLKAGASVCGRACSAFLFHRMITVGDREIVHLMFTQGVSPNPVRVHSRPSPASALFTALQYEQCDIAKFFISNWFLSKADMTMLCRGSKYRGWFSCKPRKIAKKLISQPWSLTCLSYITVSNAIGYHMGRNERINQLPLYPLFKDKLLRQDEMAQLPILQWAEIPFFSWRTWCT